jgi:hypothetical protein
MGTKLSAALIAAIVMVPAPAMAQSAIDTELAPGGQLRFGLNGANSTIVTRNADGGVGGVAPELGRFIAPKLGALFVPVLYATSAAYTDSMEKLAEWDICVTGRNPRADAKFDYSPDVIAVEYVLLAAPGKAFADVREVDRAGVTIAVARNASADVFLSRSLKSAELLRAVAASTMWSSSCTTAKRICLRPAPALRSTPPRACPARGSSGYFTRFRLRWRSRKVVRPRRLAGSPSWSTKRRPPASWRGPSSRQA